MSCICVPELIPSQIAGNQLGFVFGIDLIIAVDAQLDFAAGFDIVWPQAPSFTIDPLNGELMSMNVYVYL